jgi:hypothetical protein
VSRIMEAGLVNAVMPTRVSEQGDSPEALIAI